MIPEIPDGFVPVRDVRSGTGFSVPRERLGIYKSNPQYEIFSFGRESEASLTLALSSEEAASLMKVSSTHDLKTALDWCRKVNRDAIRDLAHRIFGAGSIND